MLKVYDGTAWVTVDTPKVWDGTAWKHRYPHYWDGLRWQRDAVIAGSYSTSAKVTWDVAAPTPTTQTYTATKAFASAWYGTYRGDNTKRSDVSDLYQGYYGSYNGNQKSLCGFSVSGIPAGATIISATVALYANHWYPNNGGTAVIGTHNKTSAPASWSTSGVSSNRLQYAWSSKSGARTITLGNTIGQEFLNGTTKGLVFGPAPTTSSEYYGYFESSGSLRPTITLKYSWVA